MLYSSSLLTLTPYRDLVYSKSNCFHIWKFVRNWPNADYKIMNLVKQYLTSLFMLQYFHRLHRNSFILCIDYKTVNIFI